MLASIVESTVNSSLYLHILIYVTRPCEPESISVIPNCQVMFGRPSLYGLLCDLASLSPASSITDAEHEGDGLARETNATRQRGKAEGGMAVCASGPATLIADAQNAAAKFGMLKGAQVGGIALHTELFAL